MLPAVHRMRSGADFSATVRAGRRSGRPLLVVHARRDADPRRPSLAGFVVGRSVGDAVTRHRVTRRLRHQLAALLRAHAAWSRGLDVVVRALPPAAGATSAQLHDQLADALAETVRRLPTPGSAT